MSRKLLSLETAARVGAVEAWITNEFEHDGLHRGDVAERLFTALEVRLGMAPGTIEGREPVGREENR
ncbi:hypothetical protein [Agromyces marinus]|uniref:Uncharacterized protein n=1 Tax=Agromyces marinus TaxID=1389020 RepID=A0ABN6YJH3_9MICO|nr:hypothetical protein [Agromyces marinus]UIP58893.1 hypothetical protein DSM26151_17820 [Agromyces marinus]BDZ56150.1 hypothetical protein GCM10025870_32230 [Agromyces marinus]